MMVYDDAEKIDGQTIEFGMRAEKTFEPFKIQGWYYWGKLVDDEEWKKRLHYDFDYYANIEDDQTLSDSAYVGHFWFGGRAELLWAKFFLELNISIQRTASCPDMAIILRPARHSAFLSLNNIFALLRFGELKIDPMRLTDTFMNPYRNDYIKILLENDDEDDERFYPLLKDPQTWNRTMVTFALGYDITSYAKLKFEYYILNEKTGGGIQCR